MNVHGLFRGPVLGLLGIGVALGIAANVSASPSQPPVIDQGSGWQLLMVLPEADEQGAGVLTVEPVPVVMIDSAAGLAESPLPESIKQELAADFDDQTADVSIAVHYDIAEAIANGTAELDYADFLEPDEDAEQGVAFFGCSTDWRHRTRTYSRGFQGVNYARQLSSGGFTGNIQVQAPLTGSGEIEVEYAFKKTSFCLPYTVKFVHARARAELDVGDTVLHAQGRARYETADRTVLAKPSFSQSFMIGPVPVVLGVEFPIGAGYGVEAQAEADVELRSGASGTMSLDVLCTQNGCSKNANGNNSSSVSFSRLLDPSSSTGSASLRVDVKPYVFVEARAYLYHSSVASAGVGAEISAPSRLFYHVGSCGPDTVNGGYVDVGAQLAFYWNATLLGFDRFNWLDTPVDGFGPFRKVDVNQFLRGGRAHKALRARLYFTDFSSGRSPLSPVLTVPGTIAQNQPASFSVGKRPCLPLDETLNYSMHWGDGTPLETFSGASGSTISRNHTYSSGGSRTITATLVSDAAGRVINESTTRSIQVIETVPPPMPSSMSVPGTDADGSFSVSWTSAATASSYKVFRRTQSGGSWGAWSQIKTVSGTSTSLSGQPFGTSQYGVQACNAYGCSSRRSSGTILIGVIPSAPTVSVMSQLCYGLNQISWSAPSGANSYQLYASVGTSPNQAGMIYSGGHRSYTINVSEDTNVWVKACGTAGCSGFSAMQKVRYLPSCF